VLGDLARLHEARRSFVLEAVEPRPVAGNPERDHALRQALHGAAYFPRDPCTHRRATPVVEGFFASIDLVLR
jgi:hypothetical protein